MKEDLELLSAEKDHLAETGEELVALIGEPDKPEVERSIDDLDTAFHSLQDACNARQMALDDALRRATAFHDQLNVTAASLCLSHTAAAGSHSSSSSSFDITLTIANTIRCEMLY